MEFDFLRITSATWSSRAAVHSSLVDQLNCEQHKSSWVLATIDWDSVQAIRLRTVVTLFFTFTWCTSRWWLWAESHFWYCV